MGDKKGGGISGGGDTTKKQQNLQQQQTQPSSSPPPKDPPVEDSSETRLQKHPLTPPHSSPVVGTGAPTFISAPLYIPISLPVTSPFDHQQQQPQFEAVNPKRPRYTSAQWKPLPNPSHHHHHHHHHQQAQMNVLMSTNTSPSQQHTAAASSSETASSHSPRPSHSAASGGGDPENQETQIKIHHQFRKGKYVSPVWKPNEMLMLARAWRVQYQGGSEEVPVPTPASGADMAVPPARGKTRADKDREVAEYLNRHGVNRDAKTAGTKWDNMLGEFRKVYEWERGGEREQVGKSYFRLSPYERKVHRLPASFDEEVFEELAQFMGSRMRTPQSRSTAAFLSGGSDENRSALMVAKALPPPLLREDDFPIFGPCASTTPKEFRRIGKIRMVWEESVSLWAEEGEHHRGRVKLQGSNFLKADELIFLDDSMVGCSMESFEDGPLKGFSVDRFVSGHQVKVFGRSKSSSAPASSGPNERSQLHYVDQPSVRSAVPSLEFQDPSEYYLGCLRGTPPTLPSLFELSWHLQEPPPEELRFPLRKDVYKDLPQGKEHFFTTSSDLLDCRAITFDLLSPIIRSNPSISAATASTRDSFIGLWDDCINRAVSKFCPIEVVVIRKPSLSSAENIQDQWPNVTGFVRNFCLWRGEETDLLREGHIDPSSSLVEKLLWSYIDLPYLLGYYAVGYMVTFCAMSRSQERIIRTDLYTLDLSIPAERLKALVPCWRIASLLPLLADKCLNFINNSNNLKLLIYSDFERIDLGKGNIMEMTPNNATKFFASKRKWAAVKEIYDYLDRRIPHAEFIFRSSDKDLSVTFKPRGVRLKPLNCDQLIEALKHVTKALVALHDISFMHRDLNWDKVMRRSEREGEWFVTGFDDAVGAPQLNPHASARGIHAPEMGRGLHGVKVDVWGIGQLVKTCGLASVPKLLRELQNRCLDHNAEQRPTAADCYHHLLQLQSSMSATAGY